MGEMDLDAKDSLLYEQLGRTIAKVREEKDYSQEKLAKKVRLTRTSITNIERGRQRIQLHTLYMIADILKVELSELLPSRKTLNQVQSAASVTVSDDLWLSKATD